jgi:hypothetical protein
MTGATSGAGTAYSSAVFEFTLNMTTHWLNEKEQTKERQHTGLMKKNKQR